MKLTIYGNDATCPSANGACSSFLLEAESKKIFIDMGNGSLAKIQQQIDITQIDAILISHLHFDHFGDLFCAKYQLESRAARGEKIKRMPLLIPNLPDWAKAELATNNIFDIITITNQLTWIMPESNIKVLFIEVDHLIESYGLRIQAEDKIFAYSGDTGPCAQIYAIARSADLFLCEATYLSICTAESAHHLSAEAAARIAKDSQVKFLVLTHLKHNMHSHLLLEARKFFDKTVVSEIFNKYEI